MFFRFFVASLLQFSNAAWANQTVCSDQEAIEQVAYVLAQGGVEAVIEFVATTGGMCWREEGQETSAEEEKSFVLVTQTRSFSIGYITFEKNGKLLFVSLAVFRSNHEVTT